MSWERYKKYCLELENLGFSLDVSRVNFDDAFLTSMEDAMKDAFASMVALEGGAIANPDENRMVGHYWLRNPEIAPTAEIRAEISENIANIEAFAQKIHAGEIKGADGAFENVLCIGIGGSALGPQFVAEALGSAKADKMNVYFLDNTDPDGYDAVFEKLDGQLGKTLAIVTSKSGGTPEPRNAMMEAIARWEAEGLSSIILQKKRAISNSSQCGIGSAVEQVNLQQLACCLQHYKVSTSRICSLGLLLWTSQHA